MTPARTKDLILDAAETLFAERGFDGTSLRTITAAAAVNLAAVHYHYGSKEALIHAVLARRLEGLNRERLELLTACESAAVDAAPAVEEVVEAFVGPALRLSQDPERGGEVFMRLMGAAYTEPGEHLLKVFLKHFGEVIRRFSQALDRALPELGPEEVVWKLHFMVGTMAHTMAGMRKLAVLSKGLCDTSNTEAVIDRLVAFIAAGMRAPTSWYRRAPAAGRGGSGAAGEPS